MAERLFKRGKLWWCWLYEANGERRQVSTKCTDREAAKLVLRRLEQEAQGAPSRSFVSVADVLDGLEKWVQQHRSPQNLVFVKGKTKPLRAGFGETTNVRGLSRRDFEKYISQRLDTTKGKKVKTKLSKYTVKREVKVFFQALRRAEKVGLVTGLDIDRLWPELEAPYVPKKVWLSREGFDDLMEQLEPCRQMWVAIAVYAGARRSEVEGLEWRDIREGEIHIRGTKTRKSDRFIPLSGKLRSVLGNGGAGLVVAPWPNVRRDLIAACERASVPTVGPNDLRRTFASWLLQAGETSSVVAELLGHTTTDLVDRTYGRLAKSTLKDAVSKL